MDTISKRTFYITIGITILLSGGIGSALTYYLLPPPVAQTTNTPVLFGLDWFYSGYHPPFFVALEKGYYRDEGLEVSIVRGYGSGDTTKRIAAGTIDIGLADTTALIISRSQGMDVQAIGAWMPHNIDCFVAFSSLGLNTPKDFEGKTYGDVQASSGYLTLPAWFALNDVDIDKVNLVNVDQSARMSLFLSGNIDITGCAIYDLYTYENAASEINQELTIMRRPDWGQDTYAHSIFASETMIQDNPEILRKFLRASYKGYEYFMQNKAESIDIILKYVPELDRGKLEDNYDRFVAYEADAYESGARGTDIGLFDLERLQSNIDLVTTSNKLPAMQVGELATNEFLK